MLVENALPWSSGGKNLAFGILTRVDFCCPSVSRKNIILLWKFLDSAPKFLVSAEHFLKKENLCSSIFYCLFENSYFHNLFQQEQQLCDQFLAMKGVEKHRDFRCFSTPAQHNKQTYTHAKHSTRRGHCTNVKRHTITTCILHTTNNSLPTQCHFAGTNKFSCLLVSVKRHTRTRTHKHKHTPRT